MTRLRPLATAAILTAYLLAMLAWARVTGRKPAFVVRPVSR